MRKVIAAINMTIDGNSDHTSISPDEEIHDHYSALLKKAGIILYGRVTYHLMEYWRTIAANPTGTPAMDQFAMVMDKVPKMVFSNSMQKVDWETATLAKLPLEEVVVKLKQEPGKDIYVGSRSLIIQLLDLGLVDELQLCIHPVITTGGSPLFGNSKKRSDLILTDTKIFRAGAIILFYQQKKQLPAS